MSFTGLLDHRARIWRRVESTGTYRETDVDYIVAYPSVRCTLKRKRAVLSEAGPGVVAVGERSVYFRRGVLLQKRDLVHLFAGPDAPAWMEVESWSRPRGHHREARCTEYHGKTPEVES